MPLPATPLSVAPTTSQTASTITAKLYRPSRRLTCLHLLLRLLHKIFITNKGLLDDRQLNPLFLPLQRAFNKLAIPQYSFLRLTGKLPSKINSRVNPSSPLSPRYLL